jgi:hypothetical protein
MLPAQIRDSVLSSVEIRLVFMFGEFFVRFTYCFLQCETERSYFSPVCFSRLRFREVNAADLLEYRDVTSRPHRSRSLRMCSGNCVSVEVQMQGCFPQINRAYIIS